MDNNIFNEIIQSIHKIEEIKILFGYLENIRFCDFMNNFLEMAV